MTIPKTQVSRPWRSRNDAALFSALSSGPNITFWNMLSRYIAARITALAEMMASTFDTGQVLADAGEAPGLVGGERAEQHQELADETAQRRAGRPTPGRSPGSTRRTPASSPTGRRSRRACASGGGRRASRPRGTDRPSRCRARASGRARPARRPRSASRCPARTKPRCETDEYATSFLASSCTYAIERAEDDADDGEDGEQRRQLRGREREHRQA